MPTTLTVDLHPLFRSERDIDNAIRSAIFHAVAHKVARLEIIPGKGSGTLKRRVLAKLAQPHVKKFYRRVEADSTNAGRILVHFDPPSTRTPADDLDDQLTILDTPHQSAATSTSRASTHNTGSPSLLRVT